MKLDLLVRDGRVCHGDQPPTHGSVGIRDGRIAVVAASADGLDAAEVIAAGGRLVMPGMIDPHIHIGHGAPHASEFWTEGYSAVVGGVTSMLSYYRRHLCQGNLPGTMSEKGLYVVYAPVDGGWQAV